MATPLEAKQRTTVGRETANPVVDGDGHLVESLPIFLSYLEDSSGPKLRDAFIAEIQQRPLFSTGNVSRGEQCRPWWPMSNDAHELATAMAPALMAQRLPEMGIDFSVLYPSMGLAFPMIPDTEIRLAAIRALNKMNAKITERESERLTVAAVIPMHTPEEAIEEINFCSNELKVKAFMAPPGVARPVRAYPDAFPAAQVVDRYGLDSQYDYDPVWSVFERIGAAVTFHGSAGLNYLESGRKSPSNYMYNHIGSHAFQQGELAKSLVMGGVPVRFPTLRFGLLECGVLWAIDLLHGLTEHWEKRSAIGLHNYDPADLDRGQLVRLLSDYGLPGGLDDVNGLESIASLNLDREGPKPVWARDEFEQSQVKNEEDFARIFSEQFFFGCEADDTGVHHAFSGEGNPFGIRMNAFFSSDVGHWDVPRMANVVPEARKLVDKGLIDEEDYADFTFRNPVRLYGTQNPQFFSGTHIEAQAGALLT